jgi:hypothetical protein
MGITEGGVRHLVNTGQLHEKKKKPKSMDGYRKGRGLLSKKEVERLRAVREASSPIVLAEAIVILQGQLSEGPQLCSYIFSQNESISQDSLRLAFVALKCKSSRVKGAGRGRWTMWRLRDQSRPTDEEGRQAVANFREAIAAASVAVQSPPIATVPAAEPEANAGRESTQIVPVVADPTSPPPDTRPENTSQQPMPSI